MRKYFIFASFCLLSGCGTLFSGTQQTVTVNTNVSEAKVYVNGMPYCTTPCTVSLKRASNNTFITLKKKGYVDATAPLTSEINPISIINLSSLYSWTTDFLSGGVWRYSPDAVYIEMEKKEMTQAEADLFSRASKIRRFVLFNYHSLKSGNFEHLYSLSELTGLKENQISKILSVCNNEIDAVNRILTFAG